ncbi:HlyD family secretion protein [Aeromonas molluscorum]|jgi:multidrug resistance efflux pump|uniref:Membrane fusion protein family auxiliary transport protein n=1 Tax=Aeromonas molluscorum 848 TaxID=1268236 RepID=R1H4Y2_9GAMM|nr:HlyD family secretion protein [Aeromonas molluscorum]EOD55596.1 membrane fusion protein family auxiliary transport protein [Aeromonas molluscorum 848]
MTPDQQFARWIKYSMVGFVLVFAYFLLADIQMPLTPQAMATRTVTRITPQVSGKIAEVAVHNNQAVKQGDLLFALDVEPFRLAVEQAQLALDQAMQDNRQLDASLEAAKADVSANQTDLDQKARDARRLDTLFAQKLVSTQQRDQANSAWLTARANLMASQARLEQIKVSRGLAGADNLRLRQARNKLAQAELNLAYSQVMAPQDGIVTNMQLKHGSFAAAGSPLLALVSDKVDLIADFREKSLRNVGPNAQALVAFDGEPGQIFQARVSSLDAGVSAGQFDANGLLANPIESDRWVRDAQRLRLHLTLDKMPLGLPTGARATVQLLPDNGLAALFARGQIRLLSLLHYIY